LGTEAKTGVGPANFGDPAKAVRHTRKAA